MIYTIDEMFDLEELVSEKERIVEKTIQSESEQNPETNNAPIKSKCF